MKTYEFTYLFADGTKTPTAEIAENFQAAVTKVLTNAPQSIVRVCINGKWFERTEDCK